MTSLPLPSTTEPYVPLRAPYDHLCLSSFLPTDAPAMTRILNQKEVYMYLTGPPFPFSLDMAIGWIKDGDGRVQRGEEAKGVVAIREIKSLSSPTPSFLGAISLTANRYTHLSSPTLRAHKAVENQQKPLGGEGGRSWEVGYYLDTAWAGKGVMSAALDVFLDYQVHQNSIDPRSIVAIAFATNPRSLKVLTKQNFRPLYLARSVVKLADTKGGESKDMWCLSWVPDPSRGYDEDLWEGEELERL